MQPDYQAHGLLIGIKHARYLVVIWPKTPQKIRRFWVKEHRRSDLFFSALLKKSATYDTSSWHEVEVPLFRLKRVQDDGEILNPKSSIFLLTFLSIILLNTWYFANGKPIV